MVCDNLVSRESFTLDLTSAATTAKVKVTNQSLLQTQLYSTNSLLTPTKDATKAFGLGSLEALKSEEIKIDELSDLSLDSLDSLDEDPVHESSSEERFQNHLSSIF